MKNSSFFERYSELLLGAGMLAFAAFYLYHATLIRERVAVSVSAKLIPEILGGMVVILGLVQLAAGVRRLAEIRRANEKNGLTPVFMSDEDKQHLLPVFFTFILIVGYALVYEEIGFIISSTLCMFLQMLLLAPKAKTRPALFAVISLASAVITYIAFRKGLNLSLPRGLLETLPF